MGVSRQSCNTWGLGSFVVGPRSLCMTLGKEHLPISLEKSVRVGKSTENCIGESGSGEQVQRTVQLHCPSSPTAVTLNLFAHHPMRQEPRDLPGLEEGWTRILGCAWISRPSSRLQPASGRTLQEPGPTTPRGLGKG